MTRAVPESIARADIKSMMARIEAPIVANQTLAAASAIFTWAIREEVSGITVNPCHGVQRNETQSRERILSDSEIPKFWSAFGEDDYLRGLALRMILLTGQPGEVRHMRTEHISDGWWTMPGKQVPELNWPGTKNGQTHRVWLPTAAQEILTEMEATGLVFAGARGKTGIDKLEAVTRDICKKLGVERATPHDLRRTSSHASFTLCLKAARRVFFLGLPDAANC